MDDPYLAICAATHRDQAAILLDDGQAADVAVYLDGLGIAATLRIPDVQCSVAATRDDQRPAVVPGHRDGHDLGACG